MTDLNDVEQIRLLEKQRYRAMQDGCSSQLLTLCHPRLAYTHSDGARDTLGSYISKLNSRHYIYHDIEHPVEDIVVVGNTALVLRRMDAPLSVQGREKELRDSSLAVGSRNTNTR